MTTLAHSKRPIAFLDRDGTLMEDTGYPRDPKRVQLCKNAPEGMRLLRDQGYRLVVVSNQSGVGRGIISRRQFKAVHERFVALLTEQEIVLDHFLYCFHHPDENCECRKPAIGLVKSFLGDAPHDGSFMVGDKLSDLQLGTNLGTPSYLVLTGEGKKTQDELARSESGASYAVFADMLSIAQHVIGRN